MNFDWKRPEIKCLVTLHFLGGVAWAVQRPQGFVVVLFQHAGLSESAAGVVSMAGLVAPILGGPLTALLADRTVPAKRYRIYAVVSFLKASLLFIAWPSLGYLEGPAAFWACLLSVAVASVCNVGSILLEWTIQYAGRDGFGKVRLWGGIGFAFGSMLTGLLAELFPKLGVWAVFPLSLAAGSAQAVVGVWLGRVAQHSSGASACIGNGATPVTAEEDVKSQQTLRDFGRFACSGTTPLFFLTLWMLGLGEGVMQAYTFTRLELLPHGTSAVMGLCAVFMIISEVPFFYFSGPMTTKLGVMPILSMALVCMSLRQTWIVVIHDALWVLPGELLHGITYSVANAAVVLHGSAIAPASFRNTIQATTSAIFTGFGQGGASLIGGVVIRNYGIVTLFRWSALGALCAAIIPSCLALRECRQRRVSTGPLEVHMADRDVADG